MALHWQWSEKCGEAIVEQTFGGETQEFTLSLYQGNAFLIFLHEFEEDGHNMWTMFNFFADKEHAERCLGLAKDYSDTNLFNDGLNKLVKISFNKDKIKKADFKRLLTMFAQAFDSLTIEIFKEDN